MLVVGIDCSNDEYSNNHHRDELIVAIYIIITKKEMGIVVVDSSR